MKHQDRLRPNPSCSGCAAAPATDPQQELMAGVAEVQPKPCQGF